MKKTTIPTETILSNLGIGSLNEMQMQTLEEIKSQDELVLLSATGSGKTLAFLLPLVQSIKAGTKTTSALIVVPSRELAMQITQVAKKMGTGLKITACYGGHKREIEENDLVEPPAIIVGTPGRLGDHFRRGNITVETIRFLVLDEFDKSLELGFQDEMQFILGSLPHIKTKILTSATDSVEVPAFVGLKDPQKLDYLSGESASTALDVRVVSSDRDKLETLFKLICALGNRLSIVFCNHREAVERISNYLSEKGITNEFYHGGMEQYERDSALSKFRNGTTSLLITTDLAARGLDIPHIRYILHYHLPLNEESFTHRNGRTARMYASGTAILILGPDETLPAYINGDATPMLLPDEDVLPEKPKWTTLFIAAGKKEKVNKVDILGFLINKANLKKEDIGVIDVKDHSSFVGIRKTKMHTTLHLIKDEKIKNKKVKMTIAK